MLDGVFRSWWLYPDGRVEPALIYDARKAYRGNGKWSPTPVFPYRNGYLIAHPRTIDPGWLGDRDAGLYRFDPNGEHERLVRGDIGPYAVSPDGCKVAFGNDYRIVHARETPLTLTYAFQLINVCTD